MKVHAWILVAAMLPLAGCETNLEKHVKDAGPATLPPNWQVAENKEEGITVGVPPGWKFGVAANAGFFTYVTSAMPDKPAQPNQPGQTPPALSPDEAKAKSEIDSIVKEETQQEADKLRSEHNIIMQVVDATMLPKLFGQQTRFLVKKVVGAHNASLEEAARDEIKFMEGGTGPERVQIPIGEALRVEGTTTYRNETLNRIAYVIVDGHTVYLLRFIGVESPASIKAVEKQVVESLRIKPPK